MSESLEKEREGTCLATEESRSSRAERWVQSGEEWGTRSKEGNGGERQRRNTSGEKGAGKRGRPTKAELLGRERRDSSVVSIPSSWFSRRGRARESEESEDEQQAAKRKKEGKAGKSPEQQGDSEEKKMANLEEIEKMMERQLQRHKDDMMKMIRRELKEEMNLDDKKEIMIRRNKLTGTKIYVDDDLTKDERERQKEIRFWAKREKERGRRVKVGFGKAWMNGLKRKDEDFWDFLKDFDVIGLSETWVEEAGWGKIKEKMPDGWRWKCQPARREKKRGRAMGGIITGIRKEIEERSRSEEEVEGIQQREVVVDEERWRIVTLYNKEGSKEELDRLKEMIGEREEENMIIVGDFNARIGKEGGFCDQNGEEKGENGKERRSKDGVLNKQGCELVKVVGERGWLILNGWKKGDEEGEWTFEKAGGKSVIDYGIVNLEAEEKIRCFEIGCRAESDHQPIMIELGKEYTRQEKEKESEAEMIQDWSEEGIEIFRKNIEDVEWEKGEGEGRWEEMEEVMKRAPKMKRRGGRKEVGWVPWWDRECREKKREVNRAGRRYRRRKTGYEEFVKKRREYRDICEKKEVEHKKLEEREIEKITTEAQAWEFINRRRKKKEGISKEIKRTEWVEYFKTALEGVDEKTVEKGERLNEVRKDEGISREEIRLEIKRLKKGKAAGIDGIRNEAWMMGGGKVRVKLEEIYRKIWEGEGFPEKWRIGVVVPKKGDKNVVGNYRGVTLTSTAYKIYANILNKKLVKELDEKGGWGRTQAGFRKGRGTIENIKILKHLVGRRLKEKKKVWAFFMDLKGAFDKIDRKVLWEMTRRREEELRKGIGGIRVGGDKVWSLEYADDIVVVAEEEVGLRAMIRGIQRYLKEKKLELSPEKSKVMVFRKKGGREKERYWWWGKERLEEVKEYKYLGYWVSRYGGEMEHVRDRIRKARVAMGWVWSYGERKFKGDA
ncbi:PREDICTED: uncharacterized protein LOC108749206 [Trachymyrmex septentrionalis]|uniref:uncharacterized protein LOC108749206 n=1 Tax=Trachymyrmex septentrionalis TaxID=34720 RepID=UPI00084EE51D|nr:PREDICTED: uncharacterized protein LOC108749206 [Trachymyrmex septentrionalis]